MNGFFYNFQDDFDIHKLRSKLIYTSKSHKKQ